MDSTSSAGFEYASIEPGYYDLVYRRCAGIQSKWHHLKFAALRAALPASGRHLDIGCGPGTFIGSLGDGLRSLGVDIAPPQIAYATATYGAPGKSFEVIGTGPLPYGAGSFDVATCVELVEHLDDPAASALLTDVRRVLAEDGRLLLTTPDYGGAWPALEWLLNRIGDVSYADQHINRFTRRRLHGTLDRAGFRDIRITRYQFVAPFLAPLGWDFADRVARGEPRWLSGLFGFLLFAEARK